MYIFGQMRTDHWNRRLMRVIEANAEEIKKAWLEHFILMKLIIIVEIGEAYFSEEFGLPGSFYVVRGSYSWRRSALSPEATWNASRVINVRDESK